MNLLARQTQQVGIASGYGPARLSHFLTSYETQTNTLKPLA